MNKSELIAYLIIIVCGGWPYLLEWTSALHIAVSQIVILTGVLWTFVNTTVAILYFIFSLVVISARYAP
ncbi:MAG: hypothetical protein PVF58_14160 [Candidatus Methanofastidiosia archaeon]|jgi:hypothetical protein